MAFPFVVTVDVILSSPLPNMSALLWSSNICNISRKVSLKDRQQEVRAVLVASRYIGDYYMTLEVLFMYHIPLYTFFKAYLLI